MERQLIGRRERLSGMELLRIVSMMMVLAVHIDGASLGLPDASGKPSSLSAGEVWQLSVEALTIIGVNCFTLISGYFGIRLKLKSIGVYLFQCIFYAVGIYTLAGIVKESAFTWTGWWESWMVLTHTDLWYVPAYFFLMLLSPFLNAGFESIRKRTALFITIGFVAFNLWAGWWWEGKFNPTGYTVVQLMMMYMIGRCVALYAGEIAAFGKNRVIVLSIILYLAMSFLTALYACWNVQKAYAYNSPAVILSSVALLIWFSQFKFRSRAINYIAKSAFAVYLIHKAPQIWGGVMKPSVIRLWESLSLFEFTLAACGIIVGIFLLSMAIDAFRRALSDMIFKPFGKIFVNLQS